MEMYMKLSNSLSLADLTKIAWAFTALEAEGVTSLSEGRRRIEEDMRIEHRLKQRRPRAGRLPAPRVVQTPCPKCGQPMNRYEYPKDHLTGETLIIDRCDGVNKIGGCRYSVIVEAK
jgi:hypothetical protein